MSKEKRRVPKLRFPGFTEDWEQRKLESLFTKYEDKISTPDSGYWRLGLRSHCKGTFHTYVDAGHELETTEMYRVKAGNFILNITFAWERALAVTDDEDQGKLVSHRFPQFKPNDDLVIDFFKHTLMDKRFKHHLELSSPGGAGRNKVLKVSDMLKYELLVPSIQEQNIISSFLNNVDYIITLHQRKLDNLKLKKKALLQKLFPKNGEQYPELRFPGFTDVWEQRKLSDISTKVTTKNVDVHYTETLTNSAEQGIISQVDFFDKEISNKDNINGYYIVENNDFIYNPRISTLAPVGPINRNKLNRTGIMSPLYTVFRASNVDLDFLEWYFQSSHWHRYMKLNGDSGARADRIAIKDSTFFDMPIKTPVSIKEEVLIGETLEKFNQYITLHQRKLDHLKLQKKALLQQMFV